MTTSRGLAPAGEANITNGPCEQRISDFPTPRHGSRLLPSAQFTVNTRTVSGLRLPEAFTAAARDSPDPKPRNQTGGDPVPSAALTVPRYLEGYLIFELDTIQPRPPDPGNRQKTAQRLSTALLRPSTRPSIAMR